MYQLEKIFEESGSPADYSGRYVDRLFEVMKSLDMAVVGQIIEALDKAAKDGKTFYFIANGGSAAVASHFVNDFISGGGCRDKKVHFKAFSLCDNVESITAIANDSGFEDIFSYQLRACLQPGDVVYAMSVSGNSENIIRAVDYAKEVGATSIGICGFEGGKLKDRCDIVLHAPTTKDEYGPVEDLFGILIHIITGYLAMDRGRRLHH